MLVYLNTYVKALVMHVSIALSTQHAILCESSKKKEWTELNLLVHFATIIYSQNVFKYAMIVTRKLKLRRSCSGQFITTKNTKPKNKKTQLPRIELGSQERQSRILATVIQLISVISPFFSYLYVGVFLGK